MKPVITFVTPLLACLAGCTSPSDLLTPEATTGAANIIAKGEIETSIDGQCFTHTAAPTRTRIIEEQVLVTPGIRAEDGTFTSPPIFRNQTRPVSEPIGEGTRFETLCPQEYTPERIATLQRALKARLAYNGPITSVFDASTRAAVQAYQTDQGFDSPFLERTLAETLGIVAVDRASL